MNRMSLDSLLDRLTKACYAAGGLLAVSLAYFSIEGFAANQNAAGIRLMTSGMKQRLADDQSKIEQAKKVVNVSMSEGLSAAGSFQSEFEAVAKKHSVEMTEFRSGTDLMPFLSAYAKDTANEGWSQIEARGTLRGRLIDVMACLTDMSHERIPFEIDTVELSRVVGEPGSILVTANVNMRVLTKAAGGKP